MNPKIRKIHKLYKAVKIGKLTITSIIEDQKVLSGMVGEVVT